MTIKIIEGPPIELTREQYDHFAKLYAASSTTKSFEEFVREQMQQLKEGNQILLKG